MGAADLSWFFSPAAGRYFPNQRILGAASRIGQWPVCISAAIFMYARKPLKARDVSPSRLWTGQLFALLICIQPRMAGELLIRAWFDSPSCYVILRCAIPFHRHPGPVARTWRRPFP